MAAQGVGDGGGADPHGGAMLPLLRRLKAVQVDLGGQVFQAEQAVSQALNLQRCLLRTLTHQQQQHHARPMSSGERRLLQQAADNSATKLRQALGQHALIAQELSWLTEQVARQQEQRARPQHDRLLLAELLDVVAAGAAMSVQLQGIADAAETIMCLAEQAQEQQQAAQQQAEQREADPTSPSGLPSPSPPLPASSAQQCDSAPATLAGQGQAGAQRPSLGTIAAVLRALKQEPGLDMQDALGPITAAGAAAAPGPQADDDDDADTAAAALTDAAAARDGQPHIMQPRAQQVLGAASPLGRAACALLDEAMRAGFPLPSREQLAYCQLADKPFDTRELLQLHEHFLMPFRATRLVAGGLRNGAFREAQVVVPMNHGRAEAHHPRLAPGLLRLRDTVPGLLQKQEKDGKVPAIMQAPNAPRLLLALRCLMEWEGRLPGQQLPTLLQLLLLGGPQGDDVDGVVEVEDLAADDDDEELAQQLQAGEADMMLVRVVAPPPGSTKVPSPPSRVKRGRGRGARRQSGATQIKQEPGA